MINSIKREVNASKKNDFEYTEYKLLEVLLIPYLFLCPFEFLLNNMGGSILKYWGFLIIIFNLAWFYKYNKKIKIEKEYIFLILWVLLGFISLFWTQGFSYGLYYVLATGNMVLIITIISLINFKEVSKNKLLNVVQLSCLVFSILMILKGDLYQGRGIRYTLFLFGKEADPNNIAGFLLPGLLISFSNSFTNKKYKFYNIIAFGTILTAIFLAGSRGGVTACVVSLIIFIFGSTKNKKLFIKNLVVIIISIVVVYFFTKYFVDQSLFKRLNPNSYADDGGSDRNILWRYGWEMIKQNPLFGYGIGSYCGTTGLGMHNTFLLIWFETGVFGLFSFIYSMFMLGKRLYKNNLYLGISILIGAMICIFFLDAYQKKFLWTNILLCTIMIKSRSQ